MDPHLAARSLEMLAAVIDAKPGAARRPGQDRMVEAVAGAIADRRHLLVEAGPGTGKSFGYLIPAIASGRRVVISTATKSLQDQLTGRDLPFLHDVFAGHGPSFAWAAVKGRANYLCMSRLEEAQDRAGTDPTLFGATTNLPDHLAMLVEWAASEPSGDRDDLPDAVPDEVWSELSVSGTECPGREHCPQAGGCFAMAALDRAFDSELVVVNHHLYGSHLMANQAILPEHDVVVFDEGHRLEDTMASTFGFEITPGRLYQVQRAARFLGEVLPAADAVPVVDALTSRARETANALRRTEAGRIEDVGGTDLGRAFVRALTDVTELSRLARGSKPERPSHGGARARLLRLSGHLAADLELGLTPSAAHVTWVERDASGPAFRWAPVRVGDLLADHLYDTTTAIVTSATLSAAGRLRPFARSIGLRWQVEADGVADLADPADPAEEPELAYRAVRVASPFDHEDQGRIYVAAHLPDPRAPEWLGAALDEMEWLVRRSGGRALILATSHRVVGEARTRLGDTLDGIEVLAQGEMPKRRLVETFERDETSVLVATMGFWEGLDIPGRSLQLVVIDKIPFPRPNDPLWQARRDAADQVGLSPFEVVDLPRAAMLLAQGAGRLIRSVDDRGVVAVLDSRLATKRYGRALVGTLPPMPVTADRDAIGSFLARL